MTDSNNLKNEMSLLDFKNMRRTKYISNIIRTIIISNLGTKDKQFACLNWDPLNNSMKKSFIVLIKLFLCVNHINIYLQLIAERLEPSIIMLFYVFLRPCRQHQLLQ